MTRDLGEDVAEMRDDIDRATQRFEQAQATVTTVSQTDSSGAVTVTVDADGGLQDVRVDQGWQQRLEPDMLGPAVQDALLAAAAARGDQWASAFAEQSSEPPPRVRPMLTPALSFAGQLGELTRSSSGGGPTTATLEALLEMVQALNASIDDVSRQVADHQATEYVGRSSSHHVTATVTGAGAVVSLRYDERWLARAHPVNVGRETTQAIHDGYRSMAGRSAQSIIDDSPLGQIQALAHDPVALAERMRLLG